MTESLAVSPDLSAYYCYLLVLFFGLLTAYVRVSRLFENFPGAWGTANIWPLLLAYTLISVVLFWFLDRTNAIHDTSVFAAILIGLGYRQIVTGKTALQIPGNIGSVWQPFEAWANWVADRITMRAQLNTERFTDRFITRVKSDPKKLDALKKLALLRSVNPQKVQADFDALNTPDTIRLWGTDGVAEKQIRSLYQVIRGIPDGNRLLEKAGIISQWQYRWNLKEWRSVLKAVLVVVATVVVLAVFVPKLFSSENWASYYLWRLQKVNATNADMVRSKEGYAQILRTSPSVEFPRIARMLRYEVLTPDTADRLLTIALENRDASTSGIQIWLIDSLRTDNPDMRARVETTLLYVADEKSLCVSQALRNWKPSKSDSATLIDQQLKEWQAEWAKGPSQGPCPESVRPQPTEPVKPNVPPRP
jgi:hypothetical protein